MLLGFQTPKPVVFWNCVDNRVAEPYNKSHSDKRQTNQHHCPQIENFQNKIANLSGHNILWNDKNLGKYHRICKIQIFKTFTWEFVVTPVVKNSWEGEQNKEVLDWFSKKDNKAVEGLGTI